VRGAKVIEFARNFLDTAAALTSGSHRDAIAYVMCDGLLQT
jgi:malate synthase